MYKLVKDNLTNQVSGIIRTNLDGTITSFGISPDNTDYQEYLAWLAEGNEPLPPDEPPS